MGGPMPSGGDGSQGGMNWTPGSSPGWNEESIARYLLGLYGQNGSFSPQGSQALLQSVEDRARRRAEGMGTSARTQAYLSGYDPGQTGSYVAEARLRGNQSTADAVNNATPVAVGDFGTCTSDFPAWALVLGSAGSGSGSGPGSSAYPDNGEIWGPQAGSWDIHYGEPGFKIIGGFDSDRQCVFVQRTTEDAISGSECGSGSSGSGAGCCVGLPVKYGDGCEERCLVIVNSEGRIIRTYRLAVANKSGVIIASG
jgi:hypothetical protein